MKSLTFILVFALTVITVQANTNPLFTIDTELAISTKGVKKIEDINVIDFHKNAYIKLMLKVKRAKKIC